MAGPRFLSHMSVVMSMLLRNEFRIFVWLVVKLVAGLRDCVNWRAEVSRLSKRSRDDSTVVNPWSGCQLDFTYIFFSIIFSLSVSANVYCILTSILNLTIVFFMTDGEGRGSVGT